MIHIFVPEINEFITLKNLNTEVHLSKTMLLSCIAYYENEITKYFHCDHYDRHSGYLFELFRQHYASLLLLRYMELNNMKLRILINDLQEDLLMMPGKKEQHDARNLLATYEQLLACKAEEPEYICRYQGGVTR